MHEWGKIKTAELVDWNDLIIINCNKNSKKLKITVMLAKETIQMFWL